MDSETHIANIALMRIGQSTIADINDTDTLARKCKLAYDSARDSVLAMHPWNCATKRVSLATVAAPAFGYSTAFQLPTDYLRIIELNEQCSDYRIEGDKLLTDDSTGELVYTSRLEDVAKMDPLLKEAICWKLTTDLSRVLKNSEQTTASSEQRFAETMADARFRDSQDNQQPTSRFSASTWLNARWRGRSGLEPDFLR